QGTDRVGGLASSHQLREDIHVTDKNIAQAAELTPIIERVHGANHPELTRVRELTSALSGADEARRTELFEELRTATQNYALPADACAAFTATYAALERADRQLAALADAHAHAHAHAHAERLG